LGDLDRVDGSIGQSTELKPMRLADYQKPGLDGQSHGIKAHGYRQVRTLLSCKSTTRVLLSVITLQALQGPANPAKRSETPLRHKPWQARSNLTPENFT
jgi:hypothetical protein